MFKTIANAWKIPDVRKKIIYTLMILVIYRLGCYVPVPGVNIDYVKQMVESNQMLGFIDIFSGGALKKRYILRIGHYTLYQCLDHYEPLNIAIPALERMAKEGDEGKKKIASITRYAGLPWALSNPSASFWAWVPNAVINTWRI